MSGTVVQTPSCCVERVQAMEIQRKCRWALAYLPWLELLLAASVVSLVLQLSWPSIRRWSNRPRAGIQVEQEARLYNYLLYLPDDYSGKERWPLLVFLHGAGNRGSDLRQVKGCGPPQLISEGGHFPMVVATPQCPPNSRWQPRHILSLVSSLCQRYQIDADRIYLAGNSMGGSGAWQTAETAPDRFAAIVPACGGGTPSQAHQLVHLSVWAFHGALDDIVPLKASQEMIEAIEAAGGTPKFTIYPDTGHGICDMTFRDPELYEWLLSQRRENDATN